jgi:hypothetical protein
MVRANEDRRAEMRDRVELSDTARSAAGIDDEARAEERTRLVSSLKAAYQGGDLATRERIEKAAERLLAGDAPDTGPGGSVTA